MGVSVFVVSSESVPHPRRARVGPSLRHGMILDPVSGPFVARQVQRRSLAVAVRIVMA